MAALALVLFGIYFGVGFVLRTLLQRPSPGSTRSARSTGRRSASRP
jgi:hypothetical protein